MINTARLAAYFYARCHCALRPSFSVISHYVSHSQNTNFMLPAYPLHYAHTTRSLSSTSSFTKTEHVHPLSQIVLKHLQSRHSEWVQSMGLDKGLELKNDGTFVLRFPQPTTQTDDSSVDTAIGAIWTTYSVEESKHYLCVRKDKIVGRYVLQDNKKPAWHTDKRSTPQRVQDAVDEMIRKMEG